MKTKFIIIIFSLIWLAIITRVFSLSVQSNDYYEKLSQNNTIRKVKIAPVRGEIVDRYNRPIAINKLGFKILLKPHLLSKRNIKVFNEEIDNIIKFFPNLDRKKIVKNYKKIDSYYNHDYINVVDFISYKDMIPVYSKLNLRKNLQIVQSPRRFYPYKEVASHIIGYVARANKKDEKDNPLLKLIGYTGKAGLENYYNKYLQGKAGYKEIKVNASNEEIEELSYKSAVEDRKLTLTIDMNLQKYITTLFSGKAGVIIVMRVDGAILAASSFPEYDINTFVTGISYKMWNKLSNSLDKPFTNKIVHGLYPPGSSIKPALGLIYITTALSPSTTVYCNAKMPLGKRIFRCWKKKGHKETGIIKAIRESCDDYFYKGSLQVGIKVMSDGLKRYGLGKETGVDLPNEFFGTVPSREWKLKKYNRPWYMGETVNTSIGQGDFLVTPLQIAQLTALLATGKLPTPHFAKQIGNIKYKSKSKNVLTKLELKRLPIIQKAMMEVCNYAHGTATHYLKALNPKIKIAGKTGTAQVVGILQDIKKRKLEHNMSYYRRSHAWFTTYGPYKNPQYIVLAMVEHGGHGGHAAGEIVSKIYNRLYKLKYLKP